MGARAARAPGRGAGANRVRIIGGAWRSRILRFHSHAELRPTPDRVRETLFNWLGQDLTGKRCLDLFAGSGALGFEAASRGARRVVMVERESGACRALEASRAALGAGTVEVRCADALEFLRSAAERYDVIFLDPPFRSGMTRRLLTLLPAVMAPGAIVYSESGEGTEPGPGWERIRQGRAGQVRFELLKRTDDEQQGGVSGNV